MHLFIKNIVQVEVDYEKNCIFGKIFLNQYKMKRLFALKDKKDKVKRCCNKVNIKLWF